MPHCEPHHQLHSVRIHCEPHCSLSQCEYWAPSQRAACQAGIETETANKKLDEGAFSGKCIFCHMHTHKNTNKISNFADFRSLRFIKVFATVEWIREQHQRGGAVSASLLMLTPPRLAVAEAAASESASARPQGGGLARANSHPPALGATSTHSSALGAWLPSLQLHRSNAAPLQIVVGTRRCPD